MIRQECTVSMRRHTSCLEHYDLLMSQSALPEMVRRGKPVAVISTLRLHLLPREQLARKQRDQSQESRLEPRHHRSLIGPRSRSIVVNARLSYDSDIVLSSAGRPEQSMKKQPISFTYAFDSLLFSDYALYLHPPVLHLSRLSPSLNWPF